MKLKTNTPTRKGFGRLQISYLTPVRRCGILRCMDTTLTLSRLELVAEKREEIRLRGEANRRAEKFSATFVEFARQAEQHAAKRAIVYHTGRTLPFCSNIIRHTEDQTARVLGMHTEEDGHRIFHTNGNRGHIGNVETTTGQPYQPSVRRFMWDLEHRDNPALENEHVVVTCGYLGNANTGDGCCTRHLTKVRVS